MPPPAQQTGSKAGLIAALVITVILLMVSVIMTITTNTDLVKKTKDLADQRKLYEKVVRTDQMLAEDTSDVALIDKEKDKFSELANPTTIDIALAEIKELNKVIDATTATSHAASTARAAEVVVRALAIVKDPSGNVPALAAPTSGPTATVVSMPDKESLFTAIDKLERRLVEITKNDAKKKADLDHLNKVLQDIKTNGDAQIAALATKADELVGKGKQAEDSKVMIQAGYIKKQEEISVENVKVVEESQKQIQDMQVRLAAATAEVARLKKALIPLQNRLALYRMDTKDSGVRVADGNIIRVVNGQTVYINLGTGDHLPAGTTFEVYDKIDGIPGLGSEPLGPNNMPKGKGSIEVVRVGQNSSECRIVHMQTGQTLSEGDILGNLVYNKDTQFHFFVYGNFDVDGNGLWTAPEAEVVKSLCTRWGGVVDDKISIKTDFIILGQEPVVPVFTQEELNDALKVQQRDQALAALAAHQKVIEEASTLHIPIMNQNRFMYYIGFFDSMKR